MPYLSRTYLLFLLLVFSIDKFQDLILPITQHNNSTFLFELNVAVLSARENFEKRQSIRDTWLKHISMVNQFAINYKVPFKVNAHFVLGNHDCFVHPLSREDLFECVPKNSQLNNISLGNKTFTLFTVKSKKTNQRFGKQFYKGFSFKTFKPLILQKIGVLAALVDRIGATNVSLLNAFTKERIFNTIITNRTIYKDSFYFTDTQINLKNGYIYILVIEHEINCEDINTVQLTIEKWNQFVKITRAYYGLKDCDSKSFDSNNDLLLLNFEFQIKKEINRNFNTEEKNYSKIWAQKLRILDQKIVEESIRYKDILFVNMTDVYRNLPNKLLLYLKHINDKNGVTHILKTDDDCYLNIFLIVELLLQHFKEKLCWFGNFRKKWPVNYYGKWADESYSSPIYPQFACGSGYILTRDLVEWLKLNDNYLHRYQGEDISMGIWMSAINPKIIQDKRWICGDESHISNQFLSAPQFTRETMIHTYSQWNRELVYLANNHFSKGMH